MSTRGSGEEAVAMTPGTQRTGCTSSPICAAVHGGADTQAATSAPPDDAGTQTRSGSSGPSEAEPLLAMEEMEGGAARQEGQGAWRAAAAVFFHCFRGEGVGLRRARAAGAVAGLFRPC